MKTFTWNEEKNLILKTQQNISFEEVITHIAVGDLLDIIENTSEIDIEEKGLLDSYENDEWQSVNMTSEKIQQYQSYAINALEADGIVSLYWHKTI